MIKEKLWKYHQLNEDNVEFIADELNTSKTVAKVLTSSGFDQDSKNELDRFLSPKIDEILAGKLKKDGRVMATGQAVGKRIGTGKVRLYRTYGEVLDGKRELRNLLESGMSMEEISSELSVFEQGDVLVTEMTTPDWEPLMKQASLIITRKGGRTSHAAIIAREFEVGMGRGTPD